MKKHSLIKRQRLLIGFLLLLFGTGSVFADSNITITGPQQNGKTVTCIVKDTDGPVVGASVAVKGTSNGQATNPDGKAVLNNVSSNAVLVISFIGYDTKEIAVGNRTIINVILTQNSQSLGEVVVTALGVSKQVRG